MTNTTRESMITYGVIPQSFLVRWDPKQLKFVVVDGSHRLKILLAFRDYLFKLDDANEGLSMLTEGGNVSMTRTEEYLASSIVKCQVLASAIQTPEFTKFGQIYNELHEKRAKTHVGDLIYKYQHHAHHLFVADEVEKWLMKTLEERQSQLETREQGDDADQMELIAGITVNRFSALTQEQIEEIRKAKYIELENGSSLNPTNPQLVAAACQLAQTPIKDDVVRSLPAVSEWVKGELLAIVMNESKKPEQDWKFTLNTLHWDELKSRSFIRTSKGPIERQVCFFFIHFIAFRKCTWRVFYAIHQPQVQNVVKKANHLASLLSILLMHVGSYGAWLRLRWILWQMVALDIIQHIHFMSTY